MSNSRPDDREECRDGSGRRKALWVSSSLTTYGGIATFVRNMRETMLWEDWHIRHVATHCDGSKATRVVVFLTGLVRFVYEVVSHRPDVVHLHTSERGSFVRKGFLIWVSAAFRLPVLIHMHGGEFHEYYENSPELIRRIISVTLERADVVVALGNTWARRLRDAAPRAHVEVVPNAIRIGTPVDQSVTDHVQVAFLGELCDRKGTTVLIDAWSAMLGRIGGMPAKLFIAGWGEIDRARCQIESLGVGDSVILAGWLSPEDVNALLRDTHILVLPSINEGQPMAILEAMSRGICVVTTTAGGIPEMLSSTDGVLVTPGDVGELACALAEAVTDPALRRGLGTHAWERVLREFDVEAVSRRFDALYRSLVGDQPISNDVVRQMP